MAAIAYPYNRAERQRLEPKEKRCSVTAVDTPSYEPVPFENLFH